MDGRLGRYVNERDEREADVRRLRREANEAAGVWIAGLREWDCFFTGTYDPRKRNGAMQRIGGVMVAPRVSRWKALRDAAWIVERASALLGTRVAAVVGVEPHLDGSYHLHGLLDLSGAPRAYRRALKWQWSEEKGFCHFDVPRDSANVSSYCSKYLISRETELWFSPGLVLEDRLSEGSE
jgi:hypothetical protein